MFYRSRGTTLIHCLLTQDSLNKYIGIIVPSPRYCGIDNEYQISSEPTNIRKRYVQHETQRPLFRFEFLLLFSYRSSLCKITKSYFFSSSSFVCKNSINLKLIIEHDFKKRKKKIHPIQIFFYLILWVVLNHSAHNIADSLFLKYQKQRRVWDGKRQNKKTFL